MWDPVLLIAQIISLQTIHYLTLSLTLPPLLYALSDSQSLAYTHGGVATVGMVMDWREMAARPLVPLASKPGSKSSFWRWIPSSSEPFPFLGLGDIDAHVSPPSEPNAESSPKDESGFGGRVGLESSGKKDALSASGAQDARRGWIIAAGWLIASGADIFILYTLIRRPTLILDFSLTLLLNHAVLTTYYASSFPTSLFFWITMGIGTVIVIVFGEQVCVRREMREGLTTISRSHSSASKSINPRRRTHKRRNTIEIFDANGDLAEGSRNAADESESDEDEDLELAGDEGEQIELMERGVRAS